MQPSFALKNDAFGPLRQKAFTSLDGFSGLEMGAALKKCELSFCQDEKTRVTGRYPQHFERLMNVACFIYGIDEIIRDLMEVGGGESGYMTAN